MAPSKKKDPSKEPPPLRPGETVVLKGGIGTKKKYNQQRALVLEIPRRGSWMTVQPIPSGSTTLLDADVPTVKWRKKGFKEILNDPMATVFNDEICLKIVDFLCEKPNTFDLLDGTVTTVPFWLFRRLGLLHATLRSVGPLWKEAFDDRIPWGEYAGLVVAGLGDWQLLSPPKEWLRKHKIQLGSLMVRAGGSDVDGVFSSTLEFVDANETQNLELFYMDCRSQKTLKLSPSTPNGFSATAAKTAGEQRAFYDALVRNWANLRLATLPFVLPQTTPSYADYVSDSFFSMPTITALELGISLSFYGDGVNLDPNRSERIEGNVFSRLIKNLPNLKRLSLITLKQDDELFKKRRFHVSSKSLVTLRIDDSKGLWVSFDCPQLENFIFNGGPNGFGLLPRITRENFESLMTNWQDVEESKLEANGQPHFAPYENYVAPHGFRGGENWKVYLYNFGKWKDHDGLKGQDLYEAYLRRCVEMESMVANTTFDTFEEN